MTRMTRVLLGGSVAALLCLSTSELMAQNRGGPGRGNNTQGGGNNQGGGRGGRGTFDPSQFVDRFKDTLEIKDDAEWQAIKPLVQKTFEARMTAGSRGRGFGGPRPGGGNTPGGPTQGAGATQATTPRDVLQKAIDSKASGNDLKNALWGYFDWRKAKQAEYEKAQADLRKVLTPRQEALAALDGLLEPPR